MQLPDTPSARRSYLCAEVAVLLCAFALALFPSQSEDLYIHLAVGRRFFRDAHFPDPDPFIYSIPGYVRGWTDVWASHLLVYLTHRAVGFAGVVILKGFLVTFGAAAPLWLARRLDTRSPLLPGVVLMALWAASPRFIERTSLFSDVTVPWIIALCLLEIHQPSQRRKWLLPAFFLVWTNLHMGVLVGLGIVGAWFVSRPSEWRRSLPIFLSCTAAACVHPTGPMTLVWAIQGVLGTGFDPYRKYIREFGPTLSIGMVPVMVLFLIVVAVAGLIVFFNALRERKARAFLLLVFGAVTYLGFDAIRFASTAAMALPVLVAGSIPVAPAKPGFQGPSRWALLAAACGFALSIKVLGWGYSAPRAPHRDFGLEPNPQYAPFAAADFVKRLPLVGNIFNQWGRGGFLAWRWDGDPKIFVHGYIIDPKFFMEESMASVQSRAGWKRAVEKFNLDVVFIDRIKLDGDKIIRNNLITDPKWRLVYVDDTSVVFLRYREEYRDVLEQYEYRYVKPYDMVGLKDGLLQHRERVRAEFVRAIRDSGKNSIVGTWARRIAKLRLHEDLDGTN